MISMTLNQFLVSNILLYIVSDMNARMRAYPRYPISDMKTPIRYDPDIRYFEPCFQ